MDDWRHSGFGLYVHWPFCQAKCPYCDFNSHVSARIDHAVWAEAYEREIDRLGLLTEGRTLNSVFFGGGTPSLMEGGTVARVLDRVRATWAVANDWEVTLEANPTSVDAARFADFRHAGVNRLSLGVQSLRDGDLRRLGRLHSAAEALAALAVARETIERVSVDLIYARQDQSADAWQAELDEVLALGLDHLSLYQLTIEPGTAFGERQAHGGLLGLPDEDLAADLYDLTVSWCEAAGLKLYEISNFARLGWESRHNRIYWTGGDYAAIGPGAHGRLTLNGQRWATESVRAPKLWLDAVFAAGNAQETWERLSASDRVTEYLLMGLRLTEGIDMTRLRSLGASDQIGERIDTLLAQGHLRRDGDRIATTAETRPLLNALLREIVA